MKALYHCRRFRCSPDNPTLAYMMYEARQQVRARKKKRESTPPASSSSSESHSAADTSEPTKSMSAVGQGESIDSGRTGTQDGGVSISPVVQESLQLSQETTPPSAAADKKAPPVEANENEAPTDAQILAPSLRFEAGEADVADFSADVGLERESSSKERTDVVSKKNSPSHNSDGLLTDTEDDDFVAGSESSSEEESVVDSDTERAAETVDEGLIEDFVDSLEEADDEDFVVSSESSSEDESVVDSDAERASETDDDSEETDTALGDDDEEPQIPKKTPVRLRRGFPKAQRRRVPPRSSAAATFIATADVNTIKYPDVDCMRLLGIEKEVTDYLEKSGWGPYFDLEYAAYTDLTKEFYSSFEFNEAAPTCDKSIRCVLGGKQCHFSIDEVNVRLGFIRPSDIRRNDTTKNFKAKLIPDAALQYIGILLQYSYSQKERNASVLAGPEVFVLLQLLRGQRFNVPALIFRQVNRVLAQRPLNHLKFSNFITALALELNFLSPEALSQMPAMEPTPLDLANLRKMQRVVQTSGEWRIELPREHTAPQQRYQSPLPDRVATLEQEVARLRLLVQSHIVRLRGTP
ncbi:hypothetical protein M569_03914 [Genlisea aurea]|uniref:Uncharacterized protein n=1 Tax=Genlisea aurea TaxID=192259 RepID=S8CVM0_9LAMI|nr:hypothetical protein M569_03914 [Genlisea aurea]